MNNKSNISASNIVESGDIYSVAKDRIYNARIFFIKR